MDSRDDAILFSDNNRAVHTVPTKPLSGGSDEKIEKVEKMGVEEKRRRAKSTRLYDTNQIRQDR